MLVLILQPVKFSPQGVFFWRELGVATPGAGLGCTAVPFVGRSPVLAQENELPQKSNRAAPFLLSGRASGFMAVLVPVVKLAPQPLLRQQ